MERTIKIIAVVMLWTVGTTAVSQTLTLKHDPLTFVAAGETVRLIAGVVPSQRVTGILYWKLLAQPAYRSVALNQKDNLVFAEVTVPRDAAGEFQYYFQAKPITGTAVTLPAQDPAKNPFKVPVRNDKAGPQVTLLSPEADVLTAEKRPVLSGTIEDEVSGLDDQSVRMTLDGKDITAAVNLTEGFFTYIPETDLSDGPHALSVTARDRIGNTTQASLPFAINVRLGEAAFQAPPAGAWNGTLSEEVQYTGMLKSPTRDQYIAQIPGLTNRVSFSTGGRSFGHDIALSAYVTTEDVPSRQMVNRFTFSIGDGLYKFTLGDFSSSLSQLTMYSVPEIRGGSIVLLSGDPADNYNKFTVLGGMTRRAVEGKDVQTTYAQYIYGNRWEVGFLSGSNLGFNYVSVNDDAGSVSSARAFTPPASNHLLSTDGRLKISPLFLTLGGEVAGSFYNYDQTVLGITGGMASMGYAAFDYKAHHLSFDYKDTGQGLPFLGNRFATLANPYLPTDYRGWELGGSTAWLDQDAFNFNFRTQIYNDNNSGQKMTTTTTNVLGLGVGYQFTPRVYSALGYSRQTQADDGTSRPQVGMSLFNNQSNTYNFNQSAGFDVGKSSTNVNGDLSYTDFKDDAAGNSYNGITVMLTESTMMDNPWSFMTGVGMTRNNMPSIGNSSDIWMANLRTGYQFIPNRFSTTAGVDVMTAKDSRGFQDNTRTNLSLTGVYSRWLQRLDSISFTLSTVLYNDNIQPLDGSSNNYSTLAANLRYTLNF